MACLNRIILTLFFIAASTAFAQKDDFDQAFNKAIVKVVPYASLQKDIHPFQTDCRNILREPQVEWNQIEIIKLPIQKILQFKISGQVNESSDVRFWSRRILLYDRNRKPIKPVILPNVDLPLKNDTGFFQIALNIPMEANMMSIPLEFHGSDTFRYLLHIREFRKDISAEAFPVLDRMGKDFCSRNMMWVGLGLFGAAQKQETSPVVTSLDLASFGFDNMYFERRWNWAVDQTIRASVHTGTMNFSPFLNVEGSERIINLTAEYASTRRHWTYKNLLFKVQYGYLVGGNFERRPFAVIVNSTTGAISLGQHFSATLGAYAELFSHNKEWYTDLSFRAHPIYAGLDHTYSGIGLSGSLGIAKPLGYERTIGIYTYGTMFQGKHSGADIKDNSEIFLFQSHLEFRYGWLF